MDAETEQSNVNVEPLDKLASFFASDAMLASQFNDTRRARVGDPGIRRLLATVLEDGVRHFIGAGSNTGCGSSDPRTRKDKLRCEAREWIFDEDADGPFSFNGVCEALDINVEYFRSKLAQIGSNPPRIPRRQPIRAGYGI